MLCQPWAKFRLMPFPKISRKDVRIQFARAVCRGANFVAPMLAALPSVSNFMSHYTRSGRIVPLAREIDVAFHDADPGNEPTKSAAVAENVHIAAAKVSAQLRLIGKVIEPTNLERQVGQIQLRYGDLEACSASSRNPGSTTSRGTNL
jgi:hypothetical protein